MARRTLHIVGDVVATLKLGGQVVKVAKPSIHAGFMASTLFSGSWTSGNGGQGIFNSSEGAEMETERLAALVQQARGRISTDQAVQLLIQLVALRASIKPIF